MLKLCHVQSSLATRVFTVFLTFQHFSNPLLVCYIACVSFLLFIGIRQWNSFLKCNLFMKFFLLHSTHKKWRHNRVEQSVTSSSQNMAHGHANPYDWNAHKWIDSQKKRNFNFTFCNDNTKWELIVMMKREQLEQLNITETLSGISCLLYTVCQALCLYISHGVAIGSTRMLNEMNKWKREELQLLLELDN